MKSFFKYLFATILGVLIASILAILVFIGIISALISQEEKTVELKNNTVFILELNKPIVDRAPNLPMNLPIFQNSQNIGLNQILENIKKAKEDSKIAGIHLKISHIPAGFASIEEIRNALADFKTSGKFVSCYSEYYSQSAYYLATIADEIYLNPAGFFQLVGIRAQGTFFKKSFEKLRIEPTVIKAGEFKGAGEGIVNEEWSEENSLQIKRIIDLFWDELSTAISQTRKLNKAQINEIADNLSIESPQDAYRFGLVDSLVYKDELISILKQKLNVDDSDDIETVSLADYNLVPANKTYKGLAKQKIAVVYASGTIIGGSGIDDQIGSEDFSKAIRDARRDTSIKAIVLRVNSPGGSALASEVIWREAKLAQETKPLVVSMGDVAASGGYFISCPADKIFVNKTTITGSIGVFSIFFNAEGFFDRIGVTFDMEKTNEHADFPAANRPMLKAEEEYWRHTTDNIYNRFLGVVSEGRKMTKEEVDKVARGRVWVATDAIDQGLADSVGGLSDAIEKARELAGLSDKYRIVELPEQSDPFEKFLKDITGETKLRMLEKQFGKDLQILKDLSEMYNNQGIMARMPFALEIY